MDDSLGTIEEELEQLELSSTGEKTGQKSDKKAKKELVSESGQSFGLRLIQSCQSFNL